MLAYGLGIGLGCRVSFGVGVSVRVPGRLVLRESRSAILPSTRVNDGSMGHWVKWVSFLDGSYGSWVDAPSPMTHLHIYRKHVVKATFVVGDN